MSDYESRWADSQRPESHGWHMCSRCKYGFESTPAVPFTEKGEVLCPDCYDDFHDALKEASDDDVEAVTVEF
jgi:protein-arginine kinase activator protein McsA